MEEVTRSERGTESEKLVCVNLRWDESVLLGVVVKVGPQVHLSGSGVLLVSRLNFDHHRTRAVLL